MHFAYDKKEVVSVTGIGILREATGRDVLASLEREDVEPGKRGRTDQERGRKQEQVIEEFETQEGLRSTHGNDTKKNLFVGERVGIEKECTEGHREDGRDEG